MSKVVAETAKVMSNGQVTLPVRLRKALGLNTGDTVTMLQKGKVVVLMNTSEYAMRVFQEAMRDEAAKVNWNDDADVSQ